VWRLHAQNEREFIQRVVINKSRSRGSEGNRGFGVRISSLAAGKVTVGLGRVVYVELQVKKITEYNIPFVT